MVHVASSAMGIMYSFLYVLLLRHIVLTAGYEQGFENRRLEYGKKEEGYVFRTFVNLSYRKCFEKCLHRGQCLSLNYNRQLHLCELNSLRRTHITSPVMFVDTQYWVYFRMPDRYIANAVSCTINFSNQTLFTYFD